MARYRRLNESLELMYEHGKMSPIYNRRDLVKAIIYGGKVSREKTSIFDENPRSAGWKPDYIWQTMSYGFRDAIEDVLDNEVAGIRDGGYEFIPCKRMSIDDVLDAIGASETNSFDPNDTRIIVFMDFVRLGSEGMQFILDVIRGKQALAVAPGLRFMFLSTLEDGWRYWNAPDKFLTTNFRPFELDIRLTDDDSDEE